MPNPDAASIAELMDQVRNGHQAVEVLHGALPQLLSTTKLSSQELSTLCLKMLDLLQQVELNRRGIEKARQEWTSAVDAVNEPVFLHDHSFNIIRANHAYAQAAGIPLDELLGRPYYDVFPIAPGPSHRCRQALDAPQASPVREELTLPDGRIFISRDYTVRDRQGHYLYSVHLLEDVTEARTAEQAMHRSETMLNRAESLAHLGSWEFDTDSQKMVWSAEVSRIFGLPQETRSGNLAALLRLIHPNDRERVAQTLNGHLGSAIDLDFRITPFEDLERLIHEHAEPMPDATPELIAGTFQDVTDSRATETALLQRSLDLGERVKELNTLFRLSRLIDQPHINAPQLLQETAQLIPNGMQHPERISVAIELGGHHFTAGCDPFPPDTAQQLTYPIKTEGLGEGVLSVEVQYDEGQGESILQEEKDMLATVAERLGHVISRWQLAQARVRTEQQLRDSNALLEQVFENVHLLIAYLDADFNFLRVNQAYAATEGKPPAYFVGKNHFVMYPNAENEAIFRQVVERGQRFQVNAKPFSYAEHPEWGTSYWDWTLTPVKDEKGSVTGVVLALIDVTERKRAEIEIEQSERRFHEIFQNNAVSIWEEDFSQVMPLLEDLEIMGIEDLEGYLTEHPEIVRTAAQRVRVIDVNETTLHMLAASDKKELLDGIQKIFPSEALEAFRQKLAALGSGATSFEGESVRRTLTGETIHVIVRLVVPQPGNFSRILVSMVDITERKRAEEALRRSEASLKETQEIAHLGNWIWNIVTNDLAWSDEIYRIFGLQPQEFGATYPAFLERVHPDDRQAVMDAVNHAVESHTPYGIVHRLIRPDGAIRIVREQGKVTYDPDDKPLRMIGAVHDITEIVQAEAMSQRLGRILDHSPSLVLVLDADTLTILQVNEGAADGLGFERDGLIGMKLGALIAEEDRSRFQHEAEQLKSGGNNQAVFEIEHRRSDGSLFPAEIRLSYASDEPTPLFLHIAQDITRRKSAETELLTTLRALKTISTCNKTLIHAKEEAQLLQDICKLVVEVGGYPMAWVGLARHDENRTVEPVAWSGNAEGYVDQLDISWAADDPHGQGPTGRAIRSGAPVIFDVNDPHFALWRQSAQAHGFFASLALPLKSGGETLGALNIYSDHPHPFTEQETAILLELADDLAFGMTTLHTRAARHEAERLAHERMEQLGRAMEQTIRAISQTIEKRDPYTAGHQYRVADLAARIAQDMGLSPQQVEAIHMGGQIHDIGKIYIPAEILGRPGKLTETEMNLIRAHPQVGYEIVSGIEFPWSVDNIIRYHHERLDGSGYPEGLKGEAIPQEARILAVADVVEAMASHRPYRPSLGLESALHEIEANAGTLYDPEVVQACLKLFREGHYTLPSP